MKDVFLGMAGYLYKKGQFGRGWKKRWCVLQNGVVHYFSEPPSEGGASKGSIALSGHRVNIY